jgi:hypothetical protein
MNYKITILLTLLLLSIMIKVVPAAEEDEFVPPDEIGKPREDTGITLDDVVGKGGFSFEPRAIAGYMSYKYKVDYEKSTDIKWQDYMPFIGAGMTLAYKNFSLDVYAHSSASGKDSLFKSQKTNNILSLLDQNANISRRDYAINFSYKTNIFTNYDNLVLSTGYKLGRSDINGLNRATIINLNQPASYNNDNTRFETKGPTISLAYGYPIGESSILGINVAYAWLGTEYISADMNVDAADTSGFTYGIKWSGAITNKLSYGLSVDYYQYSMGASSTNSGLTISSIEETVLAANASISYAFDSF